jgi:hypothetical protein
MSNYYYYYYYYILYILYFSILLHSFNTEYLFFCPSIHFLYSINRRHVSASHGHLQVLYYTLQKLVLCYANFCLCDVASHVLDMCFSWCTYCRCPSVNYIILCFVMLVIYQIALFMCLYLWYIWLCSSTKCVVFAAAMLLIIMLMI